MTVRRLRRERKKRYSPGSLSQVFAGIGMVAGLLAAGAAWLLGLGVGNTVLIGLGTIFVLAVAGAQWDLARLRIHLQELLDAGDTEAATRMLERAARQRMARKVIAELRTKLETVARPSAAAAPREPRRAEPTPETREAEATAPFAVPAAAPPVAAASAASAPEPPPPPEPVRPPTGPVLTGRGRAVVWLLVPAFLPGIGLLAGPALIVVAATLLAAREPREWDRAVAKTGLGVGLLSVATATLFLIAVFSARGSVDDLPDFVSAASIPLSVKIAQVLVLFLSIVLHECAHGAAARICGDDTASRAGRLTLNPVKHVDLVGSILLPGILILTHAGFVFGWAKPVPVRKDRYRNPRRGDLFVSSAGVLTNLLLALACGALLLTVGFVLSRAFPDAEIRHFAQPFAPAALAGVPAAGALVLFVEFLKAGILVNLLLATLNILPIPPLDGFHAAMTLLPTSLSRGLWKLAPLGFVVLVVLFTSGAFSFVALPAVLGSGIVTVLSHVLFGF